MKVGQFLDQRLGIDYDAISDDRDFFWEENPRRNQVQLEFLSVDNDGVPCIVTTLVAGNHLCIGR